MDLSSLLYSFILLFIFFFFNDTATTEIYTLSLHDALPIFSHLQREVQSDHLRDTQRDGRRSEEHTSELQSRFDLVCRLLLEKKKMNKFVIITLKKNRFVEWIIFID